MNNIDTVKSMFDSFARGDINSLLNSLSDSVVWTIPGSQDLPYSGTYTGKDGVANFFSRLASTTEMDPLVLNSIIAQGDTVVATGSSTSRAKGTNRSLSTDWCMVFNLSGGKVISFQEYLDTGTLERGYRSAKTAGA